MYMYIIWLIYKFPCYFSHRPAVSFGSKYWNFLFVYDQQRPDIWSMCHTFTICVFSESQICNSGGRGPGRVAGFLQLFQPDHASDGGGPDAVLHLRLERPGLRALLQGPRPHLQGRDHAGTGLDAQEVPLQAGARTQLAYAGKGMKIKVWSKEDCLSSVDGLQTVKLDNFDWHFTYESRSTTVRDSNALISVVDLLS